MFISITVLEIIFSHFRLANVVSRHVHLVFMKMHVFGIVSTDNKMLADGRGGVG